MEMIFFSCHLRKRRFSNLLFFHFLCKDGSHDTFRCTIRLLETRRFCLTCFCSKGASMLGQLFGMIEHCLGETIFFWSFCFLVFSASRDFHGCRRHSVSSNVMDSESISWTQNAFHRFVIHFMDSECISQIHDPFHGFTIHFMDSQSIPWTQNPFHGFGIHFMCSQSVSQTQNPFHGF